MDAYAVGEKIPTIAPGGRNIVDRGTSFSAPLVLAYVSRHLPHEKLTLQSVKVFLKDQATGRKFLLIKDF